MVRDLNNAYLDSLHDVFPVYRKGELGDTPKVNCTTCHQGLFKPLYGKSMVQTFPELRTTATTELAGGQRRQPRRNRTRRRLRRWSSRWWRRPHRTHLHQRRFRPRRILDVRAGCCRKMAPGRIPRETASCPLRCERQKAITKRYTSKIARPPFLQKRSKKLLSLRLHNEPAGSAGINACRTAMHLEQARE